MNFTSKNRSAYVEFIAQCELSYAEEMKFRGEIDELERKGYNLEMEHGFFYMTADDDGIKEPCCHSATACAEHKKLISLYAQEGIAPTEERLAQDEDGNPVF